MINSKYCVKYLINKSIDHKSFKPEDNIAYIMVLANMFHFTNFSSGIHGLEDYYCTRMLLPKFAELDLNKYMQDIKEIYNGIVSGSIFVEDNVEYFLSKSDIKCLDKAIDDIDLCTNNEEEEDESEYN